MDLVTDLQKDNFCPVSGFRATKCPNPLLTEFGHDVRHQINIQTCFSINNIHKELICTV